MKKGAYRNLCVCNLLTKIGQPIIESRDVLKVPSTQKREREEGVGGVLNTYCIVVKRYFLF
jgi:hypothetical protein